MARLNTVLTKTVRITGWPLLVLMVVYLVTGYVLCGQVRPGRWLTVERALEIHRLFVVPLVVLLAAHSLPAMYLAAVRWGWTKTKDKT